MKKTILLALAAASFLTFIGIGLSSAEEKGSVTRIEFTAVEDEEEKGDEASSVNRLRLLLSGGVGFPKMDAINDYVDYINAGFSGTVDHIDSCNRYAVDIGYEFDSGILTGIGYRHMDADTGGTTKYLSLTNNLTLDLTVDGIEIFIRKGEDILFKPLSIGGIVGAGYYTSEYTEKEDGYEVSGKDGEFGFRGGIDLNWEITETVNLFLAGDYTSLKFDSYKDGDDPITFVSPGAPAAEADFSGFGVSGGLGIRF